MMQRTPEMSHIHTHARTHTHTHSYLEVGVDAVLALSLAAVGARVSSVADAAHGERLVPQLVDVAEVSRGDLRDRLAGAVARAHAVAGSGTRGALAGSSM